MSVSRRYTSADLEAMEPRNGDRYELIDGELYVTHAPSSHHQYASDELSAALRVWSHASRLGMSFSAPGLIFDASNDVIPDLVWLSLECLRAAFDRAGHLVIAPELVVEVLSTGARNERRDREAKLALYSREGVADYWIIDVRRHEVLVYRQGGQGLRLVRTLRDDDLLESPHLPGFSMLVARLWAPSWMPDFGAEQGGT